MPEAMNNLSRDTKRWVVFWDSVNLGSDRQNGLLFSVWQFSVPQDLRIAKAQSLSSASSSRISFHRVIF